MQTLSIIKPDDWHVHLRDGSQLTHTVPATARQFARAIVMPNLIQPVTTVALAQEYYNRIIAERPTDSFQPLMTLYLTESTDIKTIKAAKNSGFIYAVKLYPAGATTNAEFGVKKLEALYPIFAAMEQVDLPLLIHGEVTYGDIFDREAEFIDQLLAPLIKTFPNLRSFSGKSTPPGLNT